MTILAIILGIFSPNDSIEIPSHPPNKWLAYNPYYQ